MPRRGHEDLFTDFRLQTVEARLGKPPSSRASRASGKSLIGQGRTPVPLPAFGIITTSVGHGTVARDVPVDGTRACDARGGQCEFQSRPLARRCRSLSSRGEEVP